MNLNYLVDRPFHCEIIIEDSKKSHWFFINVILSKTRYKQLYIIYELGS